MDDLLSEFLTETAENLEIVDAELVKLERDPNNKDTLGRIFRLVHTIKGTCGFLGLGRRDGQNAVAVTLILAALDRIKMILAALAETQKEPEGDDGPLLDRLDAGARGDFGGPAPAAPLPAPAEVAQELLRPLKSGEVSLEELEAAFAAAPGPDEIESATHIANAVETAMAQPPRVEAPKPEPAKSEPARTETSDTSKADAMAAQSIRVNVGVLENLMTMVSELVLTRNQLLDMVRRLDDSEFKAPLQRLSSVTAELQESVMKTRMQPVGNAWSKLPRIVRDLANELGKKIDLRMTGAETELDRQVLEMIKDPLTHMVRNSADHGLETLQERRAAGKPETGIIDLRAYHEGGYIIIEIADDGRGLNTDRIKAKALANGLATEAELAAMPETQVHQFIFAAGFSTAAKVTNVSGRGVGMDVVRTNIDNIGGAVSLKSVYGKGSTFTIKIPLTLAIVSALIVGAGGQRFALPQIGVVELVHASDRSEHRIETINATPVLRLRERLLPLVFLSDALGLAAKDTAEAKEAFVIVTKVGTQTFGIVVEAVHDTEEIVVKPLSSLLRNVSVFSGTTILGDGGVIMILDPNGISGAVQKDAAGRLGSEAPAQAALKHLGSVRSDEKTSILVFRAGGEEQKCVPLSLVTRLEEIEASRFERVEGRSLVQYRGVLMQILTLSPYQTLKAEGRQPVLVFTDKDRSVGLAVDEIVDIVEDTLTVTIRGTVPGVIGTAVVKGKATEVMDAGWHITQCHADWFERTDLEVQDNVVKRVLLVDDSAFFRNMMTPLLSAAGYQVTAADSPESAFKLRDDGVSFDCIISDIEMPGTDGLDFAKLVRRDDNWSATPLFALTSRTAALDVDKGLAAGFDDYFAKTDRDRLIARLEETLKTKRAA
jgi:two-component system, chemotaxis family, sensor kinase CheA